MRRKSVLSGIVMVQWENGIYGEEFIAVQLVPEFGWADPG